MDSLQNRNLERRSIPRGPPTSTTERAKGIVRGVTKASPSNPYGTRLNPNKGKLSTESAKPREERRDRTPPLPPIPIRARMPRARTPEEPNDVEMINLESPAIVGQRAENSRMNPSDETSRNKAIRGLPIAEKYSPGNLIKTTLNTPITVPIGELMVQSAELCKQMIKELQTCTVRIEEGKENDARNWPSTLNSARINSLTTRPESKKPDERASLVMIKVNLGLRDRKLWVNAIVDSGSEVNIISRPVAKELNKDYPVMPLEEARCADANRNQGILTGKFSDVLLFQGSVVTNAALFMGSYKVNFKMLLGRLWI